MPRKYDCLVKFYASWFDDLRDKDKGFTNAEIGKVLLTIAKAQLENDVSMLDELPPAIKRGLQMATLKEQVTRIIERSQSCKEKGRAGGEQTQRNRLAEQKAEEMRQRLKRNREETHWKDCKAFYSRIAKSEQVDYLEWVRKPKSDEYLRKLQQFDEPYRELDFSEWKIIRGLDYKHKKNE